ncbi:unnamed protein product [Phytophthora lilii]|uniref:Unnamed protein product n=1 Tax=Phytophthora lilii TaxID=2077276 RepID=A0A9W6WVR7_9STRA|nr:unnamed protein product [Phytophthora lilii]
MSETQLSDQYLYQRWLKSDPEIKVSSGKRVPFVIDLNRGSPQYIEKHGAESFLFPHAAQSVLYSSATSSTTGDGFTNTTAFSSSFATTGPAGGASIPNDGLVKRLLSNPPNAGSDFSASWPSVGGAAASTTISNQTARGAFVAGAATANTIMGTWNYMLRLS